MLPGESDSVVVDTNVFSYIWQRRPEAALFLPFVEGRLAYLSFQTVAELLKGAKIAEWGARRRTELDREMRKYVVVEFSMEMARIWARVMAERRAAGLPERAEDGWIAATALWVGCPIVTHNLRDFRGISGLQVLPSETPS